jgi:hypothetical protein
MLRRRRDHNTITQNDGRAFADFHEWVLSLPWTVERPYSVATPGVRCFGVDCELLGRRRMWMLTGLHRDIDPSGLGLAVMVPVDAADEIEELGWGRAVTPMPGGQSLVAVNGGEVARRENVEALALSAYSYAMSQGPDDDV